MKFTAIVWAARISALAGLMLGGSNCALNAGEQSASDDQGQAEQTQEALGFFGQDGYFQEQGSPRVFKVFGSRFCWVYDPGELGALQNLSTGQWDGFSRPTFAYIQSYGKVYQGTCGYPTGMFRRDGDAPVYSAGTTTYCHVKNDQQVNNRGGWGAVLVLRVKPGEMDIGETRAQGPDQMPLGRPRLAYTGDCTF